MNPIIPTVFRQRFSNKLSLPLSCLAMAVLLPSVSARDTAYITQLDQPFTLDGEPTEWDNAAWAVSFYEEALRPRYELKTAFAYDSKALYFAAVFNDESPLMNTTPNAQNGDGFKIRLSTSPETAVHLFAWYDTAAQQPKLSLFRDMDYHGQQQLTGSEAPLTFKPLPDGSGYQVEGRLDWAWLLAEGIAKPQAGDEISFILQPSWGNRQGDALQMTFDEFTSGKGFPHQDMTAWGKAVLLDADEEAPYYYSGDALSDAPVTFEIPLPDPLATTASFVITDRNGQTIRTLEAISQEAPFGKTYSLEWDGLDDRKNAVAAGDYFVKTLTQRGVEQRFIASIHNSGTPPWNTDDGTGAWGGDWGAPQSAASAGDRVFLGWSVGEAGTTLIALNTQASQDASAHKIWGITPSGTLDIGGALTCLAANEDYVFVGMGAYNGWDLKRGGTMHSGILAIDPATGRSKKLPFGKDQLRLEPLPENTKKLLSLQSFVDQPLFERIANNEFGVAHHVDRNYLTALAVKGKLLAASLTADNRIALIDWHTGERIQDIAVPAPGGLWFLSESKLLVASNEDILEIDTTSGSVRPWAQDVLSAPWGMSGDAEGNIYISDQGVDAMCVKVFSSKGKLLRTVGKEGGRNWEGTFDQNGMLMPAGIALDDQDRLWVTEFDNLPRRVSLWSKQGKYVDEFFGPSVPQNGRYAHSNDRSLINTHSTLFKLDYETGRYECKATLFRPNLRGITVSPYFCRNSAFHVHEVDGEQYATLSRLDTLGGLVLKWKDDHFVPVTSFGYHRALPVVTYGMESGYISDPTPYVDADQLPFFLKNGRQTHSKEMWHYWIDQNRDGLFQKEELSFENVRNKLHTNFQYFDKGLGFWGVNDNRVLRFAPKSWTDDGIPIYPTLEEISPLFTIKSERTRTSGVVLPDENEDQVYVYEQIGGRISGGADYASVSAFDYNGDRKWAYALVWPGFANDAPFWKPGYVIGAQNFVGQARRDDGLGFIVTNGYYGNYHMLTSEGHWVAQLSRDNRYGDRADEKSNFIENITGHFYRNEADGKFYLIGGDTDARVWEITGLDTVKTANIPVHLTPEMVKHARKSHGISGPAPAQLDPIILTATEGIQIDAAFDDWSQIPEVTIDGGGDYQGSAQIAYDTEQLYLSFKVNDSSPLQNSGENPNILFKSGDTVELMLRTDASQAAQEGIIAGDLRLLISKTPDGPVAMLYEKITHLTQAPATFSSPTGEETFQRVTQIEEAAIQFVTTQTGYKLEASVPLKRLGFSPTAGKATKADLGILFSNQGGNKTVRRAYYANQETQTIEDIPTEVRLTPNNWTTLKIK